jgi:hypothetical protein
MEPDKNVFVTILTNSDEWTTKPTHVAFVVAPPLLLWLFWDMFTWKIASVLNRNLHQYETFHFGLEKYWLDAKCSCTDSPDNLFCSCEAETPLGMMTLDQMNERYEHNFEDGKQMEKPHLVVERWGAFRLKVWRDYCPSPYDSRVFGFRELLDPFLPKWLGKAVER